MLLSSVTQARSPCLQVVPSERRACLKQWTVLVYMNGDNDLSPYAVADLKAMAEVGSSPAVDFVVQLDTSEDNGIRRYHVRRAPQLSASLRAQLPELDSGDMQTLIDFLAYGVKNYPARHYMVIIWSHGEGYAGGISPDYSSASRLSITELSTALEYLQYVHLQGHRIDIYASDACLMQSLEVIYQLRQRARYIVGSANIEKKSGWPYQEIFDYLTADPYQRILAAVRGAGIDTAYWLATQIPHLYLRHYYDRDRWATMNTVVAAQIARRDRQSFQQNLQRLSAALRSFVRADPLLNPLKILAAVGRSYQFAPANRDLKTFLAQLLAMTPRSSEVHRHAAATQAALAEIVLRPVASDPQKHTRYLYSRGFGYGTLSSGLTMWMPLSQREFVETKKTFADTELLRGTGWYALQAEIFAAVGAFP